jgi:hypothetical protein
MDGKSVPAKASIQKGAVDHLGMKQGLPRVDCESISSIHRLAPQVLF